MDSDNKTVLKSANAAIVAGDHERFLSFCTEDTEWEFVGDQILNGKEAVRQYIKKAYVEPPVFSVENLVGEDDFLIATGTISLKNESGQMIDYAYCDNWQLRDDKLYKLKAFVIELKK